MPVNVIIDDCIEREQIYILDPGNSRIKCLTLDGKFIKHLSKIKEFEIFLNLICVSVTDSLLESTTTGLAYRSSTSTFYLLDWKSKLITEFTLTNSNEISSINILRQITCSAFNEPVQIALFEQHSNSFLICDNNKLLIIDNQTGDLIKEIDTRSFGIKTIKAFTIGLQDEIILADHRIHIFSYEGKYIRQISSITQQQIVDVDVHVTHQPPDLIPSNYKQQSVLNSSQHSKSSNTSTTKGGKNLNEKKNKHKA